MDTAKDHLPILSSRRYRSLLVGHGWLLALYLTAAILAAWPVRLIEIPGLVDYLNHLARIHILANLETSPELQLIYSLGWPPPPNVLGDLVLLALAKVSNLYLAGRLYLLLCFTLIIGGLILLTKTLQAKVGLLPLAGFLLLYNANLDYGFLNYLLALGLVLIAFALWLRIRTLKLIRRLFLLSCFSLVIFYAHLFGLAALFLLISAYEIGAAIQDIRAQGWRACYHPILRQWLAIGLALAPILVLAVLSYEPANEAGDFTYGRWQHKIQAFLSPVGMGLDWLDPLTLLVILVPLFVWLVKGRVAPSMRLVLGIVFLVAILLPHSFGGDSWFVDFRLPVLWLLLALASIETDLGGRRERAIFVLSLLGLLSTRGFFIQEQWLHHEARVRELIAVSPQIQKGSSILVVRKTPIEFSRRQTLMQQVMTTDSDRYDWHLANLFVIERDAFTPSIFTGMNLLRVQEQYRDRNQALAKPITTEIFMDPRWLSTTRFNYQGKAKNIYWGRWPERFDYVLLLNDRWDRNPYPRFLTKIHQGSFFELYRVVSQSPLRYR